MNDFKDQFKMLRDDLALNSEEKEHIRASLIARIGEPAAQPERPFSQISLPSPFFSMPFSRGVFAFIALFAVLVGGTTVAAEGALPGETLYGIKLGLNERVERIAALGTVARAEVDVRHAEERIREVELLVAKGEEDARAVSDIALAVDAHIKLASEAAAELSEEGDDVKADLVSARIDSALAAHADILEAQAENEEGMEKRKLRALSVALSLAAKERVPQEDETKARTGEYYDRIVASREAEAERAIDELREKLRADGVPEESVLALEAEHAQLVAELERTKASDGAVRDAADTYESVVRRAYRAAALYTFAKRVNDETDKEVFMSLDGGAAERTTPEVPPSEAEVMLMAEMAPVEDAAAEEADDSEETSLRFFIRESGD